MSAADLQRHAEHFQRVVTGHPQCLAAGIEDIGDLSARLYVDVDVEMTLIERARGVSSNGVLKVERVWVVLTNAYPWREPTFRFRRDFPRNLPHLYPGSADDEPAPCLVDGAAGEYFNQFGMLELGIVYLFDQLAVWLARAAEGTLMNEAQGWEPTIRYQASGALIAETDYVRQRVGKDAGWTALKTGFYRFGRQDAVLGPDVEVFFDVENEPTALFAATKKRPVQLWSPSPERSYGKTVVGIFWSGRQPDGQPLVASEFLPETITSIADLTARADQLGFRSQFRSFVDGLERMLADQSCDYPIPIGIVFCARRPFDLMDRRTPIELLPYAIEVRPTVGRSTLFDGEDGLHSAPIRCLEKTSPALLREVANEPERAATALIGCGSVGSKIALHLARAGIPVSAVTDKSNLLPHNMARYGPVAGPLPQPKADVVAENLRNLGQSPSVYRGDILVGLADDSIWKEVAPRHAETVINSTASLLVREALSLTSLEHFPPRVSEVALFGRGEGCFVLYEGQGRNPNLVDLMAVLTGAAAPHESALLFDEEHGLAQVQIGQGCGSLTMPMSDARLSSMTAIATEEILDRWEEREGGGHVAICVRDRTTSNLTWRRLAVPPLIEIPVTGADWRVRVTVEVIDRIRAEAAAYTDVETGGFLIGSCSARMRTITVVDTLPAPPDSTRSATKFVLGTEGAQAAIRDRHQRSGGGLLDIGTWHSHLVDVGPSNLDRDTARQLADERAPPAILLIVTPTDFHCIMGTEEGANGIP
ncbi:Mov34/MPN/PAD-1 family protein [Aureimonas altamirensis]|uniref:Mov34/MPN/PAD-1 family protein n=1 Tax=Aureimonas altamirensis TaxID=370622 RepID=UPI0020371348|nr:Mov34/MPN/PAD-1 family protein [Aureimonas altamirensis]MCM2505628.1 Mov34/MPN/PAD-1 family protein [Aureimonas altamirensis]